MEINDNIIAPTSIDIESPENIDKFLWLNKKKVNNLITFDQFVEVLSKPSDLNSYTVFNNEIKNVLYWIFKDDLCEKSDKFKKAFMQWNLALYEWEGLDELINLIKLKNSSYRVLLFKSIENWKLDQLFTKEEREDLLNIIKSWLFSTIDEVFINWIKEIFVDSTCKKKKAINDWLEIENWELSYWWLKDWKIVWYNEFIKNSTAKFDKLDSINNKNIKNYLLEISNFIEEWNTTYSDWIKAEKNELNSWKDEKSSFAIVWPMEDYYYKKLLVEPELELNYKEKEQWLNEKMIRLTKKYFDDNTYDIESTTFSMIETILTWWRNSFAWALGKSFPNDWELTKSEWNFIYFKPWKLENIILNAEPQLEKLFEWEIELNKDEVRKEFRNEVTYHEYGHSLFIKWHTSKLEELKATLFYFLDLSDKNNQEEYNEEKIKWILQFCLVDSMRNLDRIEKPQYEQYTILTRAMLDWLHSNSLLSVDENDKFSINPNKENFTKFLDQMVELLGYIKSSYENESIEESKKSEENYINELVKKSDSFINKIINKIKN